MQLMNTSRTPIETKCCCLYGSQTFGTSISRAHAPIASTCMILHISSSPPWSPTASLHAGMALRLPLLTQVRFSGEAGTNGQHASTSYSGNQIIPADFIVFANTAFATKDADLGAHELFLLQLLFAQAFKALAFGKNCWWFVLTWTLSGWFLQCLEGNSQLPLSGKELNPHAVGTLIAFYSITFKPKVL